MKLMIKNMVCNRCVLVIKHELELLGLHPGHIALGEVELLEDDLSTEQYELLDAKLTELGFERINSKVSVLIEKLKSLIIQEIYHSEEKTKLNWSNKLSEELNYEYNYLSNLFSSVEGTTIEQYIIRQKIERVKELLVYNELNLEEISLELGYSSTAYLSSQFKKITGFTPTRFRQLIKKNRKPLDKL